MPTSFPLAAALCAPALLLASCSSLGGRGGPYLVYDTESGREIALEDAVERLARSDAVFLGEEHDNDTGHALQLRTVRELHERRPELVLSMEQFESDVQPALDAYLRGEIDEEQFLSAARPWPNYREHYRPLVEWAKEQRVPVVAANVPRPLATRVSRCGSWSASGEPEAPWGLWTDEPAYRARFEAAMGAHGGLEPSGMQRWFAAQCLKDEKMAESIARVFEEAPQRPLVVHLCGKFHSDERLGIVSRLLRRRPELTVAVVSMSSGAPLDRPLGEDERRSGDVLFRVPAP